MVFFKIAFYMFITLFSLQNIMYMFRLAWKTVCNREFTHDKTVTQRTLSMCLLRMTANLKKSFSSIPFTNNF